MVDWGQIAAYGTGGIGGGLLYDNWDALTGHPSVPGWTPKKPKTAGDIGISSGLTDAFGNVGTTAQTNIGDQYGSLKQRYSSDARGIPQGTQSLGPNSYGGQRFATQQGLDVGNLHAALGGQIGNASYQDALNQRDYEQRRQLAEETAALNKPSLLEEMFKGVGAVGKTAGAAYGMYGGGGGGGGSGYGSGELPQSMSMYNNSLSGYGRYS